MHRILSETVLSFAEAAASIPAIEGKHTPRKRLYVWASAGVKVGDRLVRLESCKVGRKIVTSTEALERFFAATTGKKTHIPDRTPNQRAEAAKAARERLERKWAKV